MDKYVDLTKDGAFSQKRIHKILVKGKTPWSNWEPSSWISEALKRYLHNTNVCERCGTNIEELPWDKHCGLCRRCERLIDNPKRLPWKDYKIKNGYRDVFIAEFMDIRRNHT